MGWSPNEVFILLFLLAAYAVVFTIFIINGGEKMFNWLITWFAPPVQQPKRCVDCVAMGVFRACGRQYCRIGMSHYFPDKGYDCPRFHPGENPVSRGEV